MIDKELLEKINKKLGEIKTLRNLNSKDPAFKNWHVSTISLLKMLPREFTRDVNDFKKLTFTDTGYHRGNKPFSAADNTRYLEDLDNSAKILKKITSAKIEDKTEKITPAKTTSKKKGGKTEKVPETNKKNKTKKVTSTTDKATSKNTAKKPHA
ncbi:MAG: hypothetical protein PHG41_01350 [Actinomycetota bacterium]|nr:hypothetical protein [Actinomycetota bacterium]